MCDVGSIFESSQFSSIELKIDLFEFSLCSRTNGEALIFERDSLFLFSTSDSRLQEDCQRPESEGLASHISF